MIFCMGIFITAGFWVLYGYGRVAEVLAMDNIQGPHFEIMDAGIWFGYTIMITGLLWPIIRNLIGRQPPSEKEQWRSFRQVVAFVCILLSVSSVSASTKSKAARLDDAAYPILKETMLNTSKDATPQISRELLYLDAAEIMALLWAANYRPTELDGQDIRILTFSADLGSFWKDDEFRIYHRKRIDLVTTMESSRFNLVGATVINKLEQRN